MKDVSGLLDEIINLIEGDVGEIKKLARNGRLDHGTSQDLCRYSSTVLDLNQSLEDRERAEKNKIARMSTKELEESILKKAKELSEKISK